MRRARISQEQLGHELGIAQASAGKKLLGLRGWTVDELIATARFLGVTLEQIMPEDDYAPVLTGRGRVSVSRASRDSNPQPSGWEFGAVLLRLAYCQVILDSEQAYVKVA